MKSSKQILTIVLVLLVVLLGVVSLFIAFRLQQSQAPDDSSAGILCGGYAQPGSKHCNTQEFPCKEYLCNSNGTWTQTGTGGTGECAAFPSCRSATEPQARCGDNVCNGGETCNSCAADCGGGAGCSGGLSCSENLQTFCSDKQKNCQEEGMDCGPSCGNSCTPAAGTCTWGSLGCPVSQQCEFGGQTGAETRFRTGWGGSCVAVADYSLQGQTAKCAIRYDKQNDPICTDLTQGPGAVACGQPGVSVQCGGTCANGMGKVCQNDGTWSTDCLRAHACGYVIPSQTNECTAGVAEGEPGSCQKLGYGTGVQCQLVNGVYRCVGTSSGTTAPRVFAGCGTNGSLNPGGCQNCYNNLDGSFAGCFNELSSCGANVACNITQVDETPQVPSGTIVQCNETCNSTDRLCASGLTCTTVGSENRCRLPENPTSPTCSPNTNPVVTVASTCPAGSTTPNAAISWTMGSYPAQTVRVDISTSPAFTTYWSKTVAAGTTSTNDSGFTGSTPFTLNQATTYYVRVYLTTSQISSGASSVNTATCTTVAMQCIDLQENGSEPIATGAGNVMEYTLVYQNPATTNPYTNIKLRVGTESSPVGRNALNTSSTLVDDYNYTYDAVTNRHTYKFRWEAASTSGVAVPAATYEVRVLLDGTTAITSPAECLESITLSQSVQPEPIFNIVKTSALVCESDGDIRINYTVTTTNIGPVTGVIDFVEDRYDENAAALNIVPTNLNPSYGTIANGRITWVGDTTARTYTAGQSKTFTYALTIPAANVLTFSAPGVLNQAKVQYDTSTTQDNSVTFDLRTVVNCSLPTIPNTGIFDNPNMLILGLVSVMLGIVVYKSKFGYQLSEKVVGSVYDSVNSTVDDVKGQLNNFKPYEETIMEQMENKAKGKKRSKRSKN